MSDSLTSWLAIFSLLWVLTRIIRKPSQHPYPPSPKRTWPIIGNALQIPFTRPWLTFADWGRAQDNEIMHLSALGQHIIILNDAQDVVELLEKRSATYSDRPRMPLLEQMGSFNSFNAGILPYGDLWRQHRKTFQQGFRKEVVGRYHTLVTDKARNMLQRIISQPEEFKEHYEVFAGSIILSIMYGYEMDSTKDPVFQAAKRAITLSNPEALLASLAVSTIPVILNVPKWFPGGGFHDLLDEFNKALAVMVDIPYNMVKGRMQDGAQEKPSFVQEMLERQTERGLTENDVLKNVAATGLAAGVDTINCVMLNLTLALALFPEVQERARKDISLAIGDRLPTLEDKLTIPYIEAVCLELHRWAPAVPGGLPHASIRDDIYKGYLIPKGSIMIPNIWGMVRNPDIYPEPDQFRPERFLNADGTLSDDNRCWTFGFGRRVCAGRHLASDAFWLATAYMLTALNISDPIDPTTGVKITPANVYFTNELISHPQPYTCTIKPINGASDLGEGSSVNN
ncbi:cytochrome P450 [Pluteus cervinus]|uniref:Cytochrome P450 n=1 Tax=Pluteus cervinus TaxID=181527 RepID=A0ACD3B671_9AGAR|nr:cytochrome P450 [Pluteus cervinus]